MKGIKQSRLTVFKTRSESTVHIQGTNDNIVWTKSRDYTGEWRGRELGESSQPRHGGSLAKCKAKEFELY